MAPTKHRSSKYVTSNRLTYDLLHSLLKQTILARRKFRKMENWEKCSEILNDAIGTNDVGHLGIERGKINNAMKKRRLGEDFELENLEKSNESEVDKTKQFASIMHRLFRYASMISLEKQNHLRKLTSKKNQHQNQSLIQRSSNETFNKIEISSKYGDREKGGGSYNQERNQELDECGSKRFIGTRKRRSGTEFKVMEGQDRHNTPRRADFKAIDCADGECVCCQQCNCPKKNQRSIEEDAGMRTFSDQIGEEEKTFLEQEKRRKQLERKTSADSKMTSDKDVFKNKKSENKRHSGKSKSTKPRSSEKRRSEERRSEDKRSTEIKSRDRSKSEKTFEEKKKRSQHRRKPIENKNITPKKDQKGRSFERITSDSEGINPEKGPSQKRKLTDEERIPREKKESSKKKIVSDQSLPSKTNPSKEEDAIMHRRKSPESERRHPDSERRHERRERSSRDRGQSPRRSSRMKDKDIYDETDEIKRSARRKRDTTDPSVAKEIARKDDSKERYAKTKRKEDYYSNGDSDPKNHYLEEYEKVDKHKRGSKKLPEPEEFEPRRGRILPEKSEPHIHRKAKESDEKTRDNQITRDESAFITHEQSLISDSYVDICRQYADSVADACVTEYDDAIHQICREFLEHALPGTSFEYDSVLDEYIHNIGYMGSPFQQSQQYQISNNAW